MNKGELPGELYMTSSLFPCPGYYKQCCDEHWGTRVSFNSGFLGVYALVANLCLTLCNPIDCSPPGSSVHGILQARILEWGAIAVYCIGVFISDLLCSV